METHIIYPASLDQPVPVYESREIALSELLRPSANPPVGSLPADYADPAALATGKLVAEELDGLLNEVLTPREHEVIRRRFGFDGGQPQTLAEIGRDIGVSRERIRQNEANALQKLRQAIEHRRSDYELPDLHDTPW